MKNIFLKIVSFVYPVTCCCCGRDMDALSKSRVCGVCKVSFAKVEGLICHKCGIPLPDGGEYCYVCRKKAGRYSFDSMRSAYLYKDKMRALILKFKYYDRTYLAGDLAGGMFEVLKECDFYGKFDYIVPVPSNIIKKLKRGYNQAELLAREIALYSQKPLLANALYRKKLTKPQFKLSRKERFENIKGSFFVKRAESVKGSQILLIDDISTTAATASACAKALKEAGAAKVYVFTLARD